jgi:5-methylcytosine-specific restriction endonuclease McrA
MEAALPPSGGRPLILATDVTGAPFGWVQWQDAVSYQAMDRIHRQLGQNEFVFRGGLSSVTGERSEIRLSSIILLRARNPRGWVNSPPSLNNPLLFRRDRHICCYCGMQKRTDQLTRDHIVPTSRGGANSWMNAVTCCRKCNQVKDSRTPAEAGMGMLYVPYVPSRYEGLILHNRRILADQMDFLLHLLPRNSRVRGA